MSEELSSHDIGKARLKQENPGTAAGHAPYELQRREDDTEKESSDQVAPQTSVPELSRLARILILGLSL